MKVAVRPVSAAMVPIQSSSVATTDGSVRYDVAFALVWAEGNEVLNVNEAHAYASCTDCVAVAVAFQVVLIMDDAHVVVPQNLAVAANYDCYRCITAAVANQLVLSVQGEPGEAELRELAAVWDRLIEFARRITTYSLTQIAAGLEAFKSEIVGILGEAPMIESEPIASTTSSPTSSQDGSDSPVPPGSTTTSPEPSPIDEATTPPPSPTGEGTGSPPPSPTSTTPEDTMSPTTNP